MKGKGAVRIDHNNQKEVIKSKPFFLHDPGITVVASRSHRDADTDRIISNLNHPEILSTGSSLKFLRIAEGKAHFYPRLGPTMEWDTAAAQCVLEESGGSVLRFDNLMPLEYTKENLLNPFFLAFGALLDPELLEDIITR